MRVEVPKFADYSGVIQANQAMSNAFKQLGDTSQDYLNYSEQKNQNIADNQHKANIFEETKKANQLNADKFTNEINNENAKKQANALTFQTLYPEQSQKFNSQFSGDLPNGIKMSDILGNVDLGIYNTNRQFDYTKDSDTQKRLYDMSRDEVKDKQWGQEFRLNQQKANKPNATEQLLSYLVMGGMPQGQGNVNPIGNNTATQPIVPTITQPITPSTTQNVIPGTTENANIVPNNTQNSTTVPITSNTTSPSVVQEQKPQVAQNSFSMFNPDGTVKIESKPPTAVDSITAKYDTKFTDKDGRKWGKNPSTGRQYLIEDVSQKDALTTTKLQNEMNDERISYEAAVKKADASLSQIDSLMNNKDLGNATGMYSYLSSIPGTKAKDIAAQVETVKGSAFLSAIEAMKGLGALSDAEGKSATSAIANLDTKQSEEALRKQLQQIYNSVETGRENVIKKLKSRNIDTSAYEKKKATYTDEEILNALKGGK